MTPPIKENLWQRLFAGVNNAADKFVSGVVDNIEQFIACVIDTADKHSFKIISANFRKNSKWSGARGTLIPEKKLKSKISCQTPFNGFPAALAGFLCDAEICFLPTLTLL